MVSRSGKPLRGFLRFHTTELPLPGRHHREMKMHFHTKTCAQMFIRLCLLSPKCGENPNDHHRRMDTLWYIYTAEYYSAVKRNTPQMHATNEPQSDYAV